MIDIEAPRAGRDDAREKHTFLVKFVVSVLGIGLIAATLWILWYFLSPSRTVEISAGESYSYAGYSIKVEKLTNRYCPDASDVDCKHWLNEDGVQFSYTGPDVLGLSFEYLGIGSKPVLELPGLKIELKAIEFDKNSVKIKLSKQ
ncbi:MAG: hypothetical protein M1275_00285 [Patescibacteria group bacterium]|nr:hypothetical protein [Patescibacteria group bacterium]